MAPASSATPPPASRQKPATGAGHSPALPSPTLPNSTLAPSVCYRALRTRDSRFDGVFFVAVTTTGIYCRPICPAKTPARDRCRYFRSAAAAERAGFRACFRCRPELAPGNAPVDARSRLVAAAVDRIEAGYLNEASVDQLAVSLGISPRHLHRVVTQELGVSPVELAQSRRLGLAKQLLADTAMPVADVAFAAGFASLRRFNAAFATRFGRPPTAVRRAHEGAATPSDLLVRLEYRAPYDWAALAAFLARRAIPGVAAFDRHGYRRTVQIGDRRGVVRVHRDGKRPAIVALVDRDLAPRLMTVAHRLRGFFDLDLRPEFVAAALGRHRALATLLARAPGLRLPGAFDCFELAVRAIIGQRISVAAATTLTGRMAAHVGEPIATGDPALTRLFPAAERIADLAPDRLARIGLPGGRARAIVALARAVVADPTNVFDRTRPEEVVLRLCDLPGVGPWTAHYIAMRALHWPDAFPAADLVLQRQLGVRSPRQAEDAVACVRPFRAYAAMHLWNAARCGGS